MKKFLLIATVLVLSLLIVSCGEPVKNSPAAPAQKPGNNPSSVISEVKKDEIKGNAKQDSLTAKNFNPVPTVVKGFNRLDNPTGPIINVAVKNLTDKAIKISGDEKSFYCNFLVVISQNAAGKEIGRQSLSFTLQPNAVFSQNVLLVQSDETKHFDVISGYNSPPKIVGTYVPSNDSAGKIDITCGGITYGSGAVAIYVRSIYTKGYLPGNWYAKATYKDTAGNIVATSKDIPLSAMGPDGRSSEVLIGTYGYDIPKSTTSYTITALKR